MSNFEALQLRSALFKDFVKRFKRHFNINEINKVGTFNSYQELGVAFRDLKNFVASLERVYNFSISIPEKNETLKDLFKVIFNKYIYNKKLIVNENLQ